MTPEPRPQGPEGGVSRDPRPPADLSRDRPPSDTSIDPSANRSSMLSRRIRAEIESAPSSRITFVRFMERALFDPELGYYMQSADRPTAVGDFLSAPETHPIFGWTIARRIEQMWVELGRPRPFDLIEYGAGSGTLALSILDGFRRRGSTDLLAALRYRPVEINPNRLSDILRDFERAGLAERLTAAGSPGPDSAARAADGSVPVTGVILANEFLDALPVHRLVIRGGRLAELFVTWQEGFVEVAGEPSRPELAGRLADDGIVPAELAEGQVLEICLELAPWLDEVTRRLARGFVVAIDYGYPAAELYGPRHLAGTLLGYRGHRVVDSPFDGVGLTDLTAHVDFTALAVLGERRGLRSVALTTQSEFLIGAGLEAELRALQASPATTAEDYLRARSGIVRMLDPRHLGGFRVLVMERETSAG